MRKLVDCEHCGGKKTCTMSGGKSCRECLAAAGRPQNQWGTVRCSYCGGRGKVLEPVQEEGDEAKDDES